MVEAEKVSVRIIRHSDGVPYTEYAPPNTSTEHRGSPNERYIEVSTNERYSIEVRLLHGFKLLRQPKVRINYMLDNDTYQGTLSRSRPWDSGRSYRWHREDKFGIVDRTINGEVMECGLTFGQLESDEVVSLGDKEIAQAVDEAGRIVVKIRRRTFGGKASLTSRSDNAYESDDASDEDDTEEDDGSGATHVTHGEEGNYGGHFQNGNDPILVADGEEDGEKGASGSVPDDRDDPILVTDGEEDDSDSDVHNNLEESAEPRQDTQVHNEEEIRPSQDNESSVEPRQETPTQSEERPVEPRQETPFQNSEELHPSRNHEESMDQQRRETEAHAEIRQRVTEYMEREAEPDQAKAITAVKRKIKDEQMEDFPSSNRYLMTFAEATDV